MLFIKIKSENPPECELSQGDLIIRFPAGEVILVPQKIMDCIDGLKWISMDDIETFMPKHNPKVRDKNDKSITIDPDPPALNDWRHYGYVTASDGISQWDIKYKFKNGVPLTTPPTKNNTDWGCNCPAWKFSKGIKTCKHTETVIDNL